MAYAVYVVIAKKSLAHTAPLPLAAATFLAGTLWLLPVLGWVDLSAAQLQAGWPLLLYLGAVATGLAYAAYTTGLTTVSAAAAGVIALLEPLTATTLGLIVFGEQLGPLGVTGAVVLGTALVLLVREEARGESVATPRG
jgi:DME family drug/metabolite transporter